MGEIITCIFIALSGQDTHYAPSLVVTLLMIIVSAYFLLVAINSTAGDHVGCTPNDDACMLEHIISCTASENLEYNIARPEPSIARPEPSIAQTKKNDYDEQFLASCREVKEEETVCKDGEWMPYKQAEGIEGVQALNEMILAGTVTHEGYPRLPEFDKTPYPYNQQVAYLEETWSTKHQVVDTQTLSENTDETTANIKSFQEYFNRESGAASFERHPELQELIDLIQLPNPLTSTTSTAARSTDATSTAEQQVQFPTFYDCGTYICNDESHNIICSNEIDDASVIIGMACNCRKCMEQPVAITKSTTTLVPKQVASVWGKCICEPKLG